MTLDYFRKVLGWETVYKPEVCEALAGADDRLYIHYRAEREDGSQFGTLVDKSPAYGPVVMSGAGTSVPGLDTAIPGMCLGERRMVMVPPRMGWRTGHHDTIKVEVMLVKINQEEWKKVNQEL